MNITLLCMRCCFSSSSVCLVTTKMSTAECDSGDWSAEVKQANLPVLKQEPEDVSLLTAICIKECMRCVTG